ncbi:uncharacterized protein [Parasteatoda tepidariorum]|uniref:uncharacterized protein n=1 Tax=Parasteatoda tepidariorum TaxID=114398 RepID=UPI00077FDB01|nr:uncharacterized protein LOC107453978 [Parasteatoda tepidariorum]
MVLINRCCCWNSVRKGSFASGIFTLCVYLFLFVISVFNVNTSAESIELLILNIICLIFSFFCVASSVILFVGLCVDNRLFLLPWVASVSAATILELAAAFYMLQDTIENPWILILFGTDLSFCLVSVYCIVCVISQYQQYLSGRGRAGQHANGPPIPTVRFQPSVGGISQTKTVPSISFQVTRQNGTCCRSAGGLLTVPTPNTSSMSNKSMGQTDMSSISDEPSSEVSRFGRSSTDETGDDEDSNDRTVYNSVLLRKMNSPPSIILESDETAINEENQC